MQHSECSIQNLEFSHPSACSLQDVACNTQHSWCIMQHVACSGRAAGQPFVMEKLLRHASPLNGGAIMLPQSDPTCRPCAEYPALLIWSQRCMVQLEGSGCRVEVKTWTSIVPFRKACLNVLDPGYFTTLYHWDALTQWQWTFINT